MCYPVVHAVRSQDSLEYITSKIIDFRPEIGIVLGSGLGALADKIIDPIRIPYGDIPHFPVSTVEGHTGVLIFGKLEDKNVVCMQGRFHFYEGYTMEEVVYPIRIMCKLGVKNLILTNAAGGINTDFRCGTLMFITDHINMLGTNPLIGRNKQEYGCRFPDMSEVYSKKLISSSKTFNNPNPNVHIAEGVYCAMTGPSYETPAEIKLLKTIGADAVGMSTVPEAIVARHCGMNVCGISCITNMASGFQEYLVHEEVIEMSKRVSGVFIELVFHVIRNIE